MSQAEELLNNAVNTRTTSMVEGHIVIGTDRFITVPEELKRIAVQFDHNIETVTFDCPRYWDGHDLSTMVIYINYQLSNRTLGGFAAENVVVDDTDDSMIHFDWTISNYVTQVPGPISFLVCAKEVDDEGYETLHWNSELNQELFVSQGLECEESTYYQNPDILTKLLNWMEDVNNDSAVSLDTVDITGGHRVTITTPTKSETFDVMDGMNLLEVAGFIPTSGQSVDGITQANITSFSLTVKEIENAVDSGRDVRIRLTPNGTPYVPLGGWRFLRMDLIVSYAIADAGLTGNSTMYASGVGYTNNFECVPVYISTRADNTFRLFVVDKKTIPLIVTGKFPATWTRNSGSAFGRSDDSMELSHTIDQIISAFNNGQDVRIRLVNTDLSYEFGNWNLKYAELTVCQAEKLSDGMYLVNACGTGYAETAAGRPEQTPMRLYGNGSEAILRITTPVKS